MEDKVKLEVKNLYHSFDLKEGPIEVLKIDETAGSVEINNSGTVMVVTLAQDGPKLQTASLSERSPPLPSAPLPSRH